MSARMRPSSAKAGGSGSPCQSRTSMQPPGSSNSRLAGPRGGPPSNVSISTSNPQRISSVTITTTAAGARGGPRALKRPKSSGGGLPVSVATVGPPAPLAKTKAVPVAVRKSGACPGTKKGPRKSLGPSNQPTKLVIPPNTCDPTTTTVVTIPPGGGTHVIAEPAVPVGPQSPRLRSPPRPPSPSARSCLRTPSHSPRSPPQPACPRKPQPYSPPPKMPTAAAKNFGDEALDAEFASLWDENTDALVTPGYYEDDLYLDIMKWEREQDKGTSVDVPWDFEEIEELLEIKECDRIVRSMKQRQAKKIQKLREIEEERERCEKARKLESMRAIFSSRSPEPVQRIGPRTPKKTVDEMLFDTPQFQMPPRAKCDPSNPCPYGNRDECGAAGTHAEHDFFSQLEYDFYDGRGLPEDHDVEYIMDDLPDDSYWVHPNEFDIEGNHPGNFGEITLNFGAIEGLPPELRCNRTLLNLPFRAPVTIPSNVFEPGDLLEDFGNSSMIRGNYVETGDDLIDLNSTDGFATDVPCGDLITF